MEPQFRYNENGLWTLCAETTVECFAAYCDEMGLQNPLDSEAWKAAKAQVAYTEGSVNPLPHLPPKQKPN